MMQATCERCGEEIDDVILESFELTGKLLCQICADAAYEADGGEDDAARSCAACRFRGAALNADYTRCGWLTDAQDEAGDRIPRWVHAAGVDHGRQYGLNARAEQCPAYEPGGAP